MTRPRLAVASALVSVGLVFLAAWVFELKLERAIALAPVIVLAVGAAAGLLVLWTRVALESLRRSRHPWRIVAIAVAAIAVLLVISAFVGPLPHE